MSVEIPSVRDSLSDIQYSLEFCQIVSRQLIVFLLYPIPLSTPPECSVSAIADLVFLVDGSWSVGRENFKHIRSFISALAGAFDIGEDKTRVAVVQYSTDTRTEFPLNRHSKRGELLKAINTLPYKGGNTMTGIHDRWD